MVENEVEGSELTLSVTAMRAAAARTAAVLRALSNEDRLLLLCQISQGDYSVGELEILLAIRQPTLSQQLTVLRTEGLVATRREGKQIFYRIADDNVLKILSLLYQLYCPSPNETSKRS
jgi:DNA-binding transcriptional ArsR family regulator